jgi:hypothetical protein
MKTILIFFCTLIYSFSFSQNVGINTPTPNEPLDVNGNINLTGQLKANGIAGNSGQVLQKNATNNLVWADLSEFKNFKTFECNNIAAIAGANNCTSTWSVPAGVTTIFVECWGGGGGGATLSGGAGGAYISARLSVNPASPVAANLIIGAAGDFGSTNQIGVAGGLTRFDLSGVALLTANGGNGGVPGDPSITNPATSPPSGGNYTISGIANNYLGYFGNYGIVTKLTFQQTTATEFARIINYGKGADAIGFPESGAAGGYRIVSPSFTQSIYANSSASVYGAGGGADFSGGYYGRGGRIIIRW